MAYFTSNNSTSGVDAHVARRKEGGHDLRRIADWLAVQGSIDHRANHYDLS